MRLSLLLLWPSAALAVPVEFVHQGRILDASGGVIDGDTSLTIALCDAEVGGACPYSQNETVPVADGYYAMRVGAVTPLDHTVMAANPWIEVRAGGVALSPRTKLGDVPYAAVAHTVADGGVDSAAIADGTIVAADLDTSSVQTRVSGTCPAGQTVTAIQADGTVSCAAGGVLYTQVGNVAPVASLVTPTRYVVEAPASMVGQVVPIDVTIMDSLCRDDDGCMISIQMVNWSAGQPGSVASRGERLYLSQTSDWWRFQNNDLVSLDNNGGVGEWGAWDCYFTDAETSTDTNNGRADNARGWGLLNARGGGYPDNITFCRVLIID